MGALSPVIDVVSIFLVGYKVMSGELDYFSDIVSDYHIYISEIYSISII